jgi:cytidylate kinase
MRNVLHVRLIAPFDSRVRNYARFQGINEQEAARAVRANDKANHHFVSSYFNTDVAYPLHYDLVINTETNGFEGTAHLICAGLQGLSKREPAVGGALP